MSWSGLEVGFGYGHGFGAPTASVVVVAAAAACWPPPSASPPAREIEGLDQQRAVFK